MGSQILSGLSIAGHTWNLWKGPNSNWEVLSFVSADGDITDFNADLKDFFDFLVQNMSVPSTQASGPCLDSAAKLEERLTARVAITRRMQFVHAIQSGTECFTGSANLLTESYSVIVNQ